MVHPDLQDVPKGSATRPADGYTHDRSPILRRPDGLLVANAAVVDYSFDFLSGDVADSSLFVELAGPGRDGTASWLATARQDFFTGKSFRFATR